MSIPNFFSAEISAIIEISIHFAKIRLNYGGNETKDLILLLEKNAAGTRLETLCEKILKTNIYNKLFHRFDSFPLAKC